jgi:hypothetical protein
MVCGRNFGPLVTLAMGIRRNTEQHPVTPQKELQYRYAGNVEDHNFVIF